ncbi:MAG: hypothetical protein GY861_19530 [bacterium]|nr:hypothetical protein [bacterium]
MFNPFSPAHERKIRALHVILHKYHAILEDQHRVKAAAHHYLTIEERVKHLQEHLKHIERTEDKKRALEHINELLNEEKRVSNELHSAIKKAAEDENAEKRAARKALQGAR